MLDRLNVQVRIACPPVFWRAVVLFDLLVYLVGACFVVGEGSIEAVSRDAGLFKDSLAAHLPVGSNDLPHVECRAGYPRATTTLRTTERYAWVPLHPGRLFGGPPQTLVLGDVQDDAYTFSALVREVARFHPLYCSRSADRERSGYATVGLTKGRSLLGRRRFL